MQNINAGWQSWSEFFSPDPVDYSNFSTTSQASREVAIYQTLI